MLKFNPLTFFYLIRGVNKALDVNKDPQHPSTFDQNVQCRKRVQGDAFGRQHILLRAKSTCVSHKAWVDLRNEHTHIYT